MIPRELALSLMVMGGKVLPLRGDKSPVTHLVKRGFEDASSETRDLWWFEHEDTMMVGLVPGSLGYIVLDVDVKGGVSGPNNLEAVCFAATSSKSGLWDGRTAMVRTPSGGSHIYLGKPDRSEHVGNHDLCKGVNVRSDGGYVVAPDNAGYYYAYGHDFSAMIQAPDWVMQRLRAAAAAEAEAKLDDPYAIPEARLEPMDAWHPRVTEAFKSFDPRGDRHTSMTLAVAALCSHELLGYAGATLALMSLEVAFTSAVKDRADGLTATREYRRALEGARKRVRANVSVGLEERDKDRTFIEQIILDAGGNEEDVEKVLAMEQPRLRMWTMQELMASDLKLNWLVRNVVCIPTYGQIAGEKKTLKTYLSQYLALAVATGSPFLGQFPVERQGNVVMFIGEGGRIPWTRRMPRIAESVDIRDIRDVPIHSVFQTAPLLSPAFKGTIENALEHLDPVLTVIDPFYAYHGSETNSANIHEEGALLTAVAAPFIEHGSNLLIVNHFKKGAESRGLNRITMAGSGEWVDSWMFTAEREPANLNTGDFFIDVEFGSRQWGGSQWQIDFNIGVQNAMGEESDSPIRFELRRSYA